MALPEFTAGVCDPLQKLTRHGSLHPMAWHALKMGSLVLSDETLAKLTREDRLRVDAFIVAAAAQRVRESLVPAFGLLNAIPPTVEPNETETEYQRRALAFLNALATPRSAA